MGTGRPHGMSLLSPLLSAAVTHQTLMSGVGIPARGGAGGRAASIVVAHHRPSTGPTNSPCDAGDYANSSALKMAVRGLS